MNTRIKKIVFLGSKEIGYKCLKYLNEQKNKLHYEIIGVLTNRRGDKIRKYCKLAGLRIINDLSGYLSLKDVDIAISIQYHEILQKCHIEKAREIIVNLHMAPLPEYRGCNQFSFAIIDGAKEFGTTIHRLEEGIDSGAILFERRFPIPNNCWVEKLYNITLHQSLILFKSSLSKLIKGKYKLTSQDELVSLRGTNIHYRKEVQFIKKIDLNWPREKIERYIRATSMPGFEPPYTIISGEKIHFHYLPKYPLDNKQA